MNDKKPDLGNKKLGLLPDDLRYIIYLLLCTELPRSQVNFFFKIF